MCLLTDNQMSVEDLLCSMVRQQQAEASAAEMATIVSGVFIVSEPFTFSFLISDEKCLAMVCTNVKASIFFPVPPVIQLPGDVDPQILQLQIQAQQNVSEAIAVPSTSASQDNSQVPPKHILLSRKGKREPEVLSSARTSGSAKANGSNQYISIIFVSTCA